MRRAFGVVAVAAAGLWGCQGPGPLAKEKAQPVVNRYAELVYQNYQEALAQAQALQTQVNAFVANPTPEGLEAAKAAWLASRDSYGQSEVYRFYEGPIDNEESGPEGRLNAWPLDEAYIDYVQGSVSAGIINHPAEFPDITEAVLVEQNERDGETNISTGYHAIEFLLWGQDVSASGPGTRPYTDFLDGTATPNPARRRQYLQVVTGLLVKDLESLVAAWGADGDNYRKGFVEGEPEDAVLKMLTGMGSLSGAELAGERMNVALENKDQEDEHSCFSDNTLVDIKANAKGIENVYLGRYGDVDGAGLDELVKAVDPALDTKMKEHFQASLAAIDAIPGPFDQAILGDDSADGRQKVKAAVDALRAQTNVIVEVATALGVELNLEGGE